MSMKRFGLLHHPKIDESRRLAQETELALRHLGASAWCTSAWEEAEVLERSNEADMLITFGGDGTIVRTARVTAGCNLPILGVNLGRLGFLAEVQPWELRDKLDLLLEGRFWLEERLMLHADLQRDGRVVQSFEALNDVVVSRGRMARVVRVDVYINGQHLTQYVTDGVIVSTPTGSTAYALAAGGPILDPHLFNLLLKPIAPHLNVASALVLPREAQVHLELHTEYDSTCTVDGQVDVPLENGDLVAVSASRHVCHFVRLGDRNYFYRTLVERLK
ncbi:MAG: NAD(+)/NADH kinase [Chloroflexi bacterium]|nr:NAD(+)/NADH kinase [Chloroflexota bacterium]